MALANTGRARKLDAFRVRWHEVVSRGARVGPQCLATAAAFFTRAGQPQEGIALFDAVTRGDPSIPLRRPTYEAVAHAFAALGDVAGAVAVRKAMVAALPAAAWGSSPKMALILLHALQTRLRLLPETRGAVARAAAAVVDDEERRSAMGQDPPDARIYLDAIPCSASIGAAEALVVRMRRTCLLRARPVSHAPGEPGRASAKHILLEDTGAIPPLLHLCASLRDEDAAARYFDGIVSGEVKYSRKVVAAMMKVHVATGNIDAATDLLRTATGEYKLDTGFAYYVLLIRACAEAARKDVQRDGGGDEARRHVALAETYFRSAFIATSEDSHEQSTALWRAMLAAYAAVGDVAAARDLLVRMEAGNIPTRLVAVKQHMLNAYSAAGLHDEAAKLSAEILQQRLESQERAPQLPLVLRPRADP
ncbi:hypothetical protein DIPPA_05551 [Diplonema papillatum]|nr:hypothetical protein DIPPA_05551 [Diplonema papillatum]